VWVRKLLAPIKNYVAPKMFTNLHVYILVAMVLFAQLTAIVQFFILFFQKFENIFFVRVFKLILVFGFFCSLGWTPSVWMIFSMAPWEFPEFRKFQIFLF